MYTGTRLTTAIYRRLFSRFFLREGGRLYTGYVFPKSLSSIADLFTVRYLWVVCNEDKCICYSPAGRSVLGETVTEVLSTARGRRPRAVLRPRAQFLPIRTDLGRWILHQNTNSSAVLTAFEYAAICCVFQTLRRKIVYVWKAT